MKFTCIHLLLLILTCISLSRETAYAQNKAMGNSNHMVWGAASLSEFVVQRGQTFSFYLLKDRRVQEALGLSQAQVNSVYSWDRTIKEEIAEMERNQEAAMARVQPYDPNMGRYIGENAQRLVDFHKEITDTAVQRILSAGQQRMLSQIALTGRIPQAQPTPEAGYTRPAIPAFPIPRIPARPTTTYSSRIEAPSAIFQKKIVGGIFTLDIPGNWKESMTGQDIAFAPGGAFGNRGITHGLIIGIRRISDANLNIASKNLVKGMLANNSYLRQQGVSGQRMIGKRKAIVTNLLGNSPVTGQPELAVMHVLFLNKETLVYAVAVFPKTEAVSYKMTFANILKSLQPIRPRPN